MVYAYPDPYKNFARNFVPSERVFILRSSAGHPYSRATSGQRLELFVVLLSYPAVRMLTIWDPVLVFN